MNLQAAVSLHLSAQMWHFQQPRQNTIHSAAALKTTYFKITWTVSGVFLLLPSELNK